MPLAPRRVGVVVRTKDRPLFVTRALRSVLNQTSDDWAVMLVNDGGARSPLEAALTAEGLDAHFAAGGMTVMHLAQSIGRSDAFNRGAEALDTEFVCCLDDDDTWDPIFLAALLDLHDRTSPLVADLGGVATLVTAVREDIRVVDGADTLVTLGEDDLPQAFKRSDFFLNPIAYATYRHDLYPVQWMLNRQAVLAAGGFPSAFNVMEDRAFMTRFLQTWRLAILDRKLAFHHRRVRRKDDSARSVAMNTLDNPSYDWRLYADLARVAVNTPPEATQARSRGHTNARADEVVRAAAATIIKELNDETSALWHKINGESAALRARIEALDARVNAVTPMARAEAPPEHRAWSLWDAVGSQDIGYRLGADAPFLGRLALSMAQTQPGMVLHAAPAQNRCVIQIPRTEDWCALELSLAGLAQPGGGLRCEMTFSGAAGFLFETALALSIRDRLGRRSHLFEHLHVHSCPPNGSVRVVRDFTAEDLARSDTPKLSIALPRQALDFRLCCHDLVVSRL